MNLLSLPWLLPAPGDLRAQVKAWRADGGADAAALRKLAGHALDLSQLGQIGKAMAAHQDALLTGGALREVRLAIASTHTDDFLADALPATGLRHGLLVSPHRAHFGQAAQQVLDPASRLAGFRPDFVMLRFDAAALGLAEPLLGEGEAQAALDAALALVAALRRGVVETIGAAAILHTLPPPAETLFGQFDRRVGGSVAMLADAFNRRLAQEVAGPGDLLLDEAALAQTVGLAQWHDPLRWHDAKLPFALDAVPLWADHACRLIAAARGLSRKCLVLDLDNTLWGGVIGDDGVDGIVLGQGSARGEAHLALQRHALKLRERGVMLAICSKNEDAAARLPFREHDEMALREDHIAAFVANWTDKASNLQAIAAALNIGTDALVFLDDNPAERERVRQELPMVAVPEIGDEPSDYVPLLAAAGYFEAVSFGAEDRARAAMYQANARRVGAMQAIGNMEEYLASLAMHCTIRPFDELGRARIAQLVNKSNQFNLTTRRYSEAQIAGIERDPRRFAMQVRLADRFGDNGMISVVIFDRGDARSWHCDSWLMSCRVLGRRVEEAVLAHVATAARQSGARYLTGDYLPSAKNAMVADHFEKLGFSRIADLDGGGSRWRLDLESYRAPHLPMRIDALSSAGLEA